MLIVDIRLRNGEKYSYYCVKAVSIHGDFFELLNKDGKWIDYDMRDIKWLNIV